jgi:hypothetical protein
MAAWPIRFSTGTRPGKRPHAPDLNGEDTKRTNAAEESNIIQMKDVFNRLFSGLLVAVDVPVSPFFCFCHMIASFIILKIIQF